VLLRAATAIADVDAELAASLSEEVVARIVGLVPETWLEDPAAAYRDYLVERLRQPRAFVEEAVSAR
jgi:hypothetical protein